MRSSAKPASGASSPAGADATFFLAGEGTPSTGKQYWRSLDQLADTPEFREWLHREFPEQASEMLDSGSRRSLLKLMAASIGLAGLTACRRPVERILPAQQGTEDYTHGVPVYYATAFQHNGLAAGLLVETNDGRPTKIEGNREHPFSNGAASALAQASILDLYDPDRLRNVLQGQRALGWTQFESFAQGHFEQLAANGGQGLRFLSGTVASPSLEAVRAHALNRYPNARWVEYEPLAPVEVLEGARIAFGQPLQPAYRLEQANVVVALDSDFLGVDCQSLGDIRGFADRRRPGPENETLNRLYAAESNFTLTGAMADHRVRLKPSEVGQFAAELARELGAVAAGLPVLNNAPAERRKWITAIANDLKANGGRSLVVAGPRQPAAVHAIVFSINQALGNVGQTVTFHRPASAGLAGQAAALRELTSEMAAGGVNTLVILGGNPAYNAPADFGFAEGVQKVGTVIHVTVEANETSAQAHWTLPEAHYLESWSDTRALDGTASVQQPMIAPIFGARTAAEVVAGLSGYPQTRAYDIVRSVWVSQWPAAEAERRWRKSLHDGLIAGTAQAPVPVTLARAAVDAAAGALEAPSQGIDVEFFADASAWDGRYANNGWLQETPDPITKLTWDNAALLSRATADSLNIRTGDMLALEKGGLRIEAPAMVQPGHADNAISIALGYGRTACGRIGRGTGHNAYPLRASTGLGFLPAVQVTRTGARYELVTTQEHHSMEGRDIVREAAIEDYRKDPRIVQKPPLVELIKLHPEPITYEKGSQWGMTIDLSACIGCNACMLACQSENNIPIVGKVQVRRGREMNWIRLDRYYAGPVEDPQLVYQPMTCQHCENAPCENVCPVQATVHSEDGLNVMVYNRCIGTRYCSNNCPYKVRRFNFLAWHKRAPESDGEPSELQWMGRNPQVSVRMRGVMEKCTYCVQRIQQKKIQAKTEGRRALRDGEIVTACQQTCPADAIVFGDINDPESRVAKLKKEERNYVVLEDLNVRPRTSYLAKLRNPNPELG